MTTPNVLMWVIRESQTYTNQLGASVATPTVYNAPILGKSSQ